MSKIVDDVLAANARYVAGFGNKGQLALPPARQFAVLTCMDARLDPAKYGGLAEGDAPVIRKAGGRGSDDAIRALVILYKHPCTRVWVLILPTGCGIALFTNYEMGKLLSRELKNEKCGQ